MFGLLISCRRGGSVSIRVIASLSPIRATICRFFQSITGLTASSQSYPRYRGALPRRVTNRCRAIREPLKHMVARLSYRAVSFVLVFPLAYVILMGSSRMALDHRFASTHWELMQLLMHPLSTRAVTDHHCWSLPDSMIMVIVSFIGNFGQTILHCAMERYTSLSMSPHFKNPPC